MGIEEQIDRLIDAGDDILKALKTLNERVAEIAKRLPPTVAIVEDEPPPAKPKRWRYRKEHESVQPGDWANSVRHALGSWPPAAGWVDAESCIGMRVGEVIDQIRIACEVTDDADQSDQSCDAGEKVEEEPVEEPQPEHPAGPMPDPGEGYRILSKDPPEELVDGDESWWRSKGRWCRSQWAETGAKGQGRNLWYRRKIEPAKEPEPEYRDPVLPMDAGKQCEFSDDGKSWADSKLFAWMDTGDFPWRSTSGDHWRYARIRKDA